MEYTEGVEAPRLFRLWTGIGTISAALRRNVYVKTRTGSMFPNLYLMFVARPGVGKSNAISYAADLLSMVDGINILPSVVTREQLYNELQDGAIRAIDTAKNLHTMAAAVGLPDELGTFIKKNDFDFMQVLTKLYDCPKLYTYKLKHGEGNRLENVSLTILGGTQPETLRRLLPEEAFGMGFAARLIILHSEERARQPLFASLDEETKSKQRSVLIDDLNQIAKLNHKYAFHREAADAFEEWYMGGMTPEPIDKRLEAYNQRRMLHLMKLCMIITAQSTDSDIITLDHFNQAKEILLEAETGMPKAFEAMGENPLLKQIQSAIGYVVEEYNRTKAPVPEHRLRHHLLREIPPQLVRQVVTEIHMSGNLRFMGDQEGNRMIVPGKNKLH